jgi:hypothetical protein
VSFAREGLPNILIAALVAAAVFGLALNRRSWPLWLLAFALTIASLWVAYHYRAVRRTGLRDTEVVASPARSSAPTILLELATT